MRVLVACEFSGAVRDAFLAAGHDAMSCDLLPTEKPGPHHQGDVRDILGGGWDMLIAHPPCTYLANSGVRWLGRDNTRWAKLEAGAAFFRLFLESPIPLVAIENPIMHKYARELIGGARPTQVVQPWMFGHTECKATCLWLKGLPALQPTNDVRQQMAGLPNKQRQRIFHLPPSATRATERSRTFSGIAAAMANQWGVLGSQEVRK